MSVALITLLLRLWRKSHSLCRNFADLETLPLSSMRLVAYPVHIRGRLDSTGSPETMVACRG